MLNESKVIEEMVLEDIAKAEENMLSRLINRFINKIRTKIVHFILNTIREDLLGQTPPRNPKLGKLTCSVLNASLWQEITKYTAPIKGTALELQKEVENINETLKAYFHQDLADFANVYLKEKGHYYIDVENINLNSRRDDIIRTVNLKEIKNSIDILKKKIELESERYLRFMSYADARNYLNKLMEARYGG